MYLINLIIHLVNITTKILLEHPTFVYIDEEEIKFTIDEADIQMVLDMPSRNIENDAIEVKPKLKENFVLKEAK